MTNKEYKHTRKEVENIISNFSTLWPLYVSQNNRDKAIKEFDRTINEILAVFLKK